ncbi:MAG: bifunctional ornithine acetyltransferase/N-acetylglutamate synthase, partial [Thermoguttaceae bacterium]|nr:bifunctional ornithine acetyltransferase/N-acetylglutamate synthase [Thermoguttaceae bacterium]
NGFKLFENGAPAPFDAKEVSKSMADNREVEILLTFKEGPESIRFWTTDLSEEYIHINADYTT